MVEDRDRDRVEAGAHAKRLERLDQLRPVKVAHLQAATAVTPDDPIDDPNTHRLHPPEIIVKRSRGIRGGPDPKPGFQMRLDRPVGRAAAHRDTGQQ